MLDPWAYQNGVKIDFSWPGKPTVNGRIKPFNWTCRGEYLNRYVPTTQGDAK